MSEPEKSKVIYIVTFVAAGLLLAGGAFYLAGSGEREIKRAVQSQLFDPESAMFRNIKLKDAGACGEVNAKNRLGGYIGYQIFYYSKSYGVIIKKPDMSEYKDSPEDLKHGFIGCVSDQFISEIIGQ